jgi:hypothetical protein
MRKSIGLICVLALGLTAAAQQAATPSQPNAAAQQGSAAPVPADQNSQPLQSVEGAKLPPGATADDLRPPEHPITAEQVHQLMDLTGMSALQRQMFQGLMPAIRQSMPPYIPDDVFNDFQNRILGGDMDSLIVTAYQKHVSTEDAAVMIDFYKTPAGHRATLVMPILMKELQAGGARLGEDTMFQVLQAHHLEIDAAKQKYEQEHPSSAPKD